VAELLTYRDGTLHATRGEGGAMLEVSGGGDVRFESRLQPRPPSASGELKNHQASKIKNKAKGREIE
jgi:hypothetical protein